MWNLDGLEEKMGQLEDFGFAYFPAPLLKDLEDTDSLRALQSEWGRFALDKYLPERGDYRFRQYSVANVDKFGSINYLSHRAFHQSTSINPLMGGIDRLFDPVALAIRTNKVFAGILRGVVELLDGFGEAKSDWEIDVHCFRVIARRGKSGQPVPKGGFHREGKDFVAIILMDRRNVSGGASLIADIEGHIVLEHTLQHPLELLIINDRKMLHTASEIVTTMAHGYRDILNLDILKI